jgi:hypothetical protein
MRRPVLLAALVLAANAPLSGQSSLFGVRGLGHPGRPQSVASLGTAGANESFDGRSAGNPASIGLLNATVLGFTSSLAWRSTSTAAGDGSTREHRFPHFLVGGPIPGTRLAGAVSFSNYAVRDYTLVTEGTDAPRGVPIAISDTVGSTGGINDLRVAMAWTPTHGLTLGGGVHLLTGSNRVFSVRAWEDPEYLPVRQRAELAYAGFGVSAGLVYQAGPRLHLAASVRHDGSLELERDSVAAGTIDLPLTIQGAARLRLSERIAASASAKSRSWSRADDGVVALGGVGARNTVEFAAGVEMVRNLRSPDHLPIRVGVRHGQLPFLLHADRQASETGIAVGTGLRFAGGTGGIDLSLERITRTEDESVSESAWHLSIGVSLRGLLPPP